MAQMKLYDLYNRAVYGTIIRLIKDPMETEDLMQDTFLSAFDNVKNFRSESSFGTWIKRIAINKSLNSLRKKSPDYLDIPEERIPDTNNKEIDEQTSRFTLDEIKQEINRLPEGYRVVINLYLIEGMDHDEISDILNIKSVTSRSQYLRAKKKLAENLMENYHERQA
jgi:RNA polymerase sigma-70 factor (ECF subfamily)